MKRNKFAGGDTIPSQPAKIVATKFKISKSKETDLQLMLKLLARFEHLHATNFDIQTAIRDVFEDTDKIELYGHLSTNYNNSIADECKLIVLKYLYNIG